MGELAALAAAALWAVASTMYATTGRRIPSVPLNLVKTGGALVLLQLTLLLTVGRVWPASLSAEDFGWLALSGLLGLTIGDSAYLQALRRLGPRRTLLLWALIPPVTALAAVPSLGEPITPGMLAGILITGAGVTWVLQERSPQAESSWRIDATGLGYGGLAVLCQVAGSLLAKAGGGSIDALELSVVRLVVGTAGLLLMVLVAGRRQPWLAEVRRPKVLAVVSLATVLGGYLGIWLSMLALQLTLAGIVATLLATSPIFALPIAYFWLREPLTRRAIAGAFVAVVGVAILVFSEA